MRTSLTAAMAGELDISVSKQISATPARVAAIMFDARQEPNWMKAIQTVEPVQTGTAPVTLGDQYRRFAAFFGKTLSWVTEVVEFQPDTRIRLQISAGPFVGSVTYSIAPAADGSHVTIRNQGKPTQFAWMPAAMITAAMDKNLRADLERLEAMVTNAS